MNPFMVALSAGYTASTILKHISKLMPSASKRIAKASAMGYSADQIVKFLSDKSSGVDYDEVLRSPNRTYAKNSQKRDEQVKNALKTGITAAGSALAYNSLKPTNPNTPPSGVVYPSQIIQTNPTQQPRGLPNAPGPRLALPTPNNPSNVNPPPTPSPSSPVKPISPPPSPPASIIPASKIINDMGFGRHVESLANAGNDPQEIAAAIHSLMKHGQKQWFDKQVKQGITKPLEELIPEYLGELSQNLQKNVSNQQNLSEITPNSVQDSSIIKGENVQAISQPKLPKESTSFSTESDNVKPLDIEPTPIEKGVSVMTPDGKIGQIKAKSPKGNIVEVDGKAKQFKDEDLESEPSDVKNIVENILKIPENDRSSLVALFTYDPTDNEMLVQYHNGEMYKYLDVNAEDVFKVAEKMGIPVTKGQNIFGAWSPDDKKSLGAALTQLFLQNPKYRKPKKGEPANPNYRKLETKYDYFEGLRTKPKSKRPTAN